MSTEIIERFFSTPQVKGVFNTTDEFATYPPVPAIKIAVLFRFDFCDRLFSGELANPKGLTVFEIMKCLDSALEEFGYPISPQAQPKFELLERRIQWLGVATGSKTVPTGVKIVFLRDCQPAPAGAYKPLSYKINTQEYAWNRTYPW